MTTAAQRDKQVTAAEKRRDTAVQKRDKAKREYDEQVAIVDTQERRITWLKGMPVDDQPAGDSEGSGELTRALDGVEGGGSVTQGDAPGEDEQAL